jgi:hypothetical protein
MEEEMKLIERYLHEVGRYLPRKNREDILAEIKSHLSDTLEERVQGEASEEDVVALLKETGAPHKLASSYPGSQQYLVGPEIYPFFRMVVSIVLAAVIGAQLLAIGISVWMGEGTVNLWQTLGSLLVSIPTAIGSVVITFMILQRFGVQPKLDDEPWDPRSLPVIEEAEEIKRGELIFGIAAGSVVLAVLAFIPDKIGIYNFTGGEFYPNPVIMQYFGWLCLSVFAAIGLDIYLLWQGRWTIISRIARIGVNLLSITVLILLVQGHTAWLAANGSSGLFPSLELLTESFNTNFWLVGMESFRLAFAVALVVTAIETIGLLFKLVRGTLIKKQVPGTLPD